MYASYELPRELVDRAVKADFSGRLRPLRSVLAASSAEVRPFTQDVTAALENYVMPALERRVRDHAIAVLQVGGGRPSRGRKWPPRGYLFKL